MCKLGRNGNPLHFIYCDVLPVNAFYELRPEAEKQKALAQKSYEALFDNLDENYIDLLLAQFEEDD